MIKKNNGITLIALIITIIVMLILAAVTISIAVGGGLFGYAGNAAKETEAAKQDELSLADGVINGKTIEQIVNGESIPTLNEYGFYYDSPYSVTLSQNNRASVVLKENHKLELYSNGIPSGLEAWSLEYVPGNNKVTINNIDCNCSNDGKTITVPGALMSALTNGMITSDTDFTNIFEQYHDIYYDVIYYQTFKQANEPLMVKNDGIYMVEWEHIPTTLTKLETLSVSGHVLPR